MADTLLQLKTHQIAFQHFINFACIRQRLFILQTMHPAPWPPQPRRVQPSPAFLRRAVFIFISKMKIRLPVCFVDSQSHALSTQSPRLLPSPALQSLRSFFLSWHVHVFSHAQQSRILSKVSSSHHSQGVKQRQLWVMALCQGCPKPSSTPAQATQRTLHAQHTQHTPKCITSARCTVCCRRPMCLDC